MLTDGFLEPIGRCENCGRLLLEVRLTEFLGDVLCTDCLELAKNEYHLVGWDVD